MMGVSHPCENARVHSHNLRETLHGFRSDCNGTLTKYSQDLHMTETVSGELHDTKFVLQWGTQNDNWSKFEHFPKSCEPSLHVTASER